MDTMTVLDGRYELRQLLGRGGMADVWSAHDRSLDRDVAVKVLRGVEAEHEKRFAAEVRTLARLDHPNLVRLIDAGEHEGRAYFVMDLVDGESLADTLEAGPLPPERVAEIGVGLAGALAAIHEQGIVHRDVKPGNVLCGRDGRVRLSDFGIARLIDAGRLTTSGSTMGTAAYLAPEQVRGEAAGPTVDVYGLGLVLLEALTGERAFDGPPMEAALARLSREPDVPADLPAPWPELLAEMTRGEPSQRPSAADVAARLGASPALVGDEHPTVRLATATPEPASATQTQRLDLPPAPLPDGHPDGVDEAAPVRVRRPLVDWRRWWGVLVGAGVLLLILIVFVLAGGDADEGLRDDTPPTPVGGSAELPPALDRALVELEELTRP